jgi:hypothetical protein
MDAGITEDINKWLQQKSSHMQSVFSVSLLYVLPYNVYENKWNI